MFDEKVILLDLDTIDWRSALNKVANVLITKKIVKTSYKQAIVEREEKFATGLLTQVIGVAIPHTDAKYVNKDQIAFARLKNPVRFKQMGDESTIEVKLIFMLALKEAHTQLATLQKLMVLFQNESLIKRLLLAPDNATVIDIFHDADLILEG